MVGGNSKVGKNRCDMNKKCCCPISGRHCNALWGYKNGKEIDFSRDSVVSDHHIVPRKRGGSSRPNNISQILVKLHEKYHVLFGNKTPAEILYFLENYFWDGNTIWINGYVKILTETRLETLKMPKSVVRKTAQALSDLKYSCPISDSSCKVLWGYERKLSKRLPEKE